jgi:quercetin dioxygenase-like cupin family protein
MTTKLVALALLCLMTGTAIAQQAKVTSLMSKDLPENPGKEVLMITVEHAPGGSSPIHRHDAQAFVYVLEGSVKAARHFVTLSETWDASALISE